MYDAKQLGKNRYCIFDSGRQVEEQVRTVKISAIAEALEKGQFILYYQPKVNMLTGELVGVEALLRWNHPETGIMPPDSFLPIIEGTDLARRVDEWVLEEALCQLSCWRKDGLSISMSVNVSGSYLKKDVFALRLKEILSKYPDVPRDCLELELLESSELDNITQTSEVMAQCHALGVRFAVDDFGTGYSSLLYLKKLPANTIKIDQSFIRNMLDDKEDFALVKGVVGLAQAFGRDVLAEGVETIEHGVALLQLGCTLGQGYGIARPMPAERLKDWARTWTLPECWRQPAEDTN
jgi:EAL domain-containing protein (putative c-di-GMP-specific phosphodiesterase class I)